MAYERVYPFGVVQENWRAAVLASVIQNSNCSKQSQAKSARWFYDTYFSTEPAVQSEDAMIAAAMKATVQLGGKIHGDYQ